MRDSKIINEVDEKISTWSYAVCANIKSSPLFRWVDGLDHFLLKIFIISALQKINSQFYSKWKYKI